MTPNAGVQAPPSQTLSRGIRALEILADAPEPMTIAELAVAMGVHRSVAYRILRTLEDHSLLVRDDAGRVQPGLAVLARGVSRNLQTAALPELTQLANALAMSAFLAVWDREDCVTLVTVDPAPPRRPRRRPAPGIAAPDQRRRPRDRHPVRLHGGRMARPGTGSPAGRAEAATARRLATPPATTRSSGCFVLGRPGARARRPARCAGRGVPQGRAGSRRGGRGPHRRCRPDRGPARLSP